MAKWYEDGPIKPPPKRKKRKKSYYKPVAKPKEPKAVTLSEREEKFLTGRFIDNLPHIEAAVKAGYTEKYARTCLYKNFWHGKSWQKKVAHFTRNFPEIRKRIAIARLPKLAQIEEKALDHLMDKPRDFLRFGKAAADREYQFAGLAGDPEIRAPTICISKIRNLMIQTVAQSPGRLGQVPMKQITDDATIEVDVEEDQ